MPSFCHALLLAGLSLATLARSADPAFRLSQAELDATLNCGSTPLSALAGKDVLLLVPGTASTAYESFGPGYIKLAPQLNKTACSISPPPSMLGDITLNAEHVVNAINKLSAASGKKIALLTWSQGGLASQWGFTFFPSTRSKISSFVALAPDFRGTVVAWATLVPLVEDVLPRQPALIQQRVGSNFLSALEKYGGLKAFVPTTTSSSDTDQVVVYGPTSAELAGAANFRQQMYCPAKILNHEGQLSDGFAYSLAAQAFSSSSGTAQRADLKTCYTRAPGLNAADIAYLDGAVVRGGVAIASNLGLDVGNDEPALPAYAGGPERRQLGRLTRSDIV